MAKLHTAGTYGRASSTISHAVKRAEFFLKSVIHLASIYVSFTECQIDMGQPKASVRLVDLIS